MAEPGSHRQHDALSSRASKTGAGCTVYQLDQERLGGVWSVAKKRKKYGMNRGVHDYDLKSYHSRNRFSELDNEMNNEHLENETHDPGMDISQSANDHIEKRSEDSPRGGKP